MFVKNKNGLVFIKSKNINAFPCGRRRGIINKESAADVYIPFDPEARLNTEANNRKHSSINGFKQSYLKWTNDGTLLLVIEGYLFNITLTYIDASNTVHDYSTVNSFGSAIENILQTNAL